MLQSANEPPSSPAQSGSTPPQSPRKQTAAPEARQEPQAARATPGPAQSAPQREDKRQGSASQTESSQAASPVDFWPSLLPALRGELRTFVYPYLKAPYTNAVTLQNGVFTLWVRDDFSKKVLEDPAVLKTIAEAVSTRTGSPVRVSVSVGQPNGGAAAAPAPEQPGDPLEDLFSFGDYDNISIT